MRRDKPLRLAWPLPVTGGSYKVSTLQTYGTAGMVGRRSSRHCGTGPPLQRIAASERNGKNAQAASSRIDLRPRGGRDGPLRGPIRNWPRSFATRGRSQCGPRRCTARSCRCLRAIVYQQLSGKAAATIYFARRRPLSGRGNSAPEEILEAPEASPARGRAVASQSAGRERPGGQNARRHGPLARAAQENGRRRDTGAAGAECGASAPGRSRCC